MFVDFNILNQLGSPSINSNTFANRPSAGQVGRLFVSTDTFEIYRDNGTGWDLIGGPGSSTVTGSGAAGQVTYWTGTNSVGGENNLWWDAANNHLGINTSTPGVALDVHSAADVGVQLNGTGATPSILQAFLSAGVSQYQIGYNWNSDINYRRFSIYDSQGSKEVISIDQQSRYVGINYQYSSLADQPAYTFDVSGSGRITDNFFVATNGSGTGLGVGITANSNWDTNSNYIQLKNGSFILNYNNLSQTIIGNNVYYNGGWVYVNSAAANLFYTTSGEFIFYNAPIGTSGTSATFTERAKLNSVGDFSVGTTTADIFSNGFARNVTAAVTGASTTASFNVSGGAAGRFQIGVGSTRTAIIYADNSNFLEISTSVNIPIQFSVNNTQAARISTARNFLIGTATDAGQKLQVSGTGMFITSGNSSYNPASVIPTVQILTSGASNSRYTALLLESRGTFGQGQSNTIASVPEAIDGNAALVFTYYGSYTSGEGIRLNSSGNTIFSGSIKTGAPTTGTAAEWKLGQRVAAAVVLDATQYIEVEVGGTFYKLAIVT